VRKGTHVQPSLAMGVALYQWLDPSMIPAVVINLRYGIRRSTIRQAVLPQPSYPGRDRVIVDLRVRFEVRTRTLIQETTMTDARMALADLIEKGADAHLVREMLSFAAGG